jgi:hypothetical protein
MQTPAEVTLALSSCKCSGIEACAKGMQMMAVGAFAANASKMCGGSPPPAVASACSGLLPVPVSGRFLDSVSGFLYLQETRKSISTFWRNAKSFSTKSINKFPGHQKRSWSVILKRSRARDVSQPPPFIDGAADRLPMGPLGASEIRSAQSTATPGKLRPGWCLLLGVAQ